MRSLADLAAFAFSRMRRRGSLTAMGASDAESTPQAIPESIWPRRILLAMYTVASRLVPHACWRSQAGVSGDNAELNTASRVRLKSRECLRTAPPATSPTRSTAQSEARDEPIECGRQHVVVRRLGIGSSRLGERNAVAADDHGFVGHDVSSSLRTIYVRR